VIRANILEDIHKQFIIFQLLKAIKYMHTAQVIHRDMKPSNLLLNSECLVKIADFGLARSVDFKDKEPGRSPVLTDYVATRWYRAPEILLGSTTYTKGVDMWSIGCILGELLGGKPMFPGTSTMNQLDRIVEVSGRPSKEDVDAIQSEFAATMLDSLPDAEARSLQTLYPNASEDALDLLQKLLMFNPDKRITAEGALEHPYVAQFHNPDEEIACEKQIQMPINDNKKLSVAAYREELYASVCKIAVEKKEVRAKKPKKKSTKKPSTKKKSTKKEGSAASSGSGEKKTTTKKKKTTTKEKKAGDE